LHQGSRDATIAVSPMMLFEDHTDLLFDFGVLVLYRQRLTLVKEGAFGEPGNREKVSE